ncbi:hypothetical protein [Roseateles sp.]|uniref:hypothetical protein n=1 Tax=Roseateles sp. TaxID=1971397 RepID=UPI0031D4F209
MPHCPSPQEGCPQSTLRSPGKPEWGASPPNARTDDLLDAGESSGGEPGRAVSSSALEGAQGVEALKRQERPELGLPSDTSNDADRARPGLGDFARGA